MLQSFFVLSVGIRLENNGKLRKGDKKMSKEIPKEIFESVMRLFNKPNPGILPMTRLEEQKLEMLCACYKNDKMLRTWIFIAFDVFSQAALLRKSDILVDGFMHLREMILGERR